MLNVLAILFATTVYSSSPILLNILLISPAILLLPMQKTRNTNTKKSKPAGKSTMAARQRQQQQQQQQALPVRPFITMYRSSMMVITCIAILAVDFPIFPRRFAKVENWGTSLMDLGVGSFVFSAGVVSARSVLRSGRTMGPLLQRLVTSVRHSLPLIVLGLIRLYSVKGLDYAEHVTEYGVHWNFFFTLGFLPPFVEIFDSLTAFIPWYDALALAIAILYQIALESTDLKAYILVSPRGPDLLSKNREGVFSFLGYLAIFLAGRATGVRAIPRTTSSNISSPMQGRNKLLMKLAVQTLAWSGLFFFNSTYAMGYGAGIPVSRRLANMPYVLWVCAFNNAQLLLLCRLETAFFLGKSGEVEDASFATSRIFSAFNRNGLAIFLIANLLTGLVNLSVNTLDVSTAQAMAILVGYSALLTSVALGLDKMNIVLRL